MLYMAVLACLCAGCCSLAALRWVLDASEVQGQGKGRERTELVLRSRSPPGARFALSSSAVVLLAVWVLCSLALPCALCLAGFALELLLCYALDWRRRMLIPGLMKLSPRGHLKPRSHATNHASKRPRHVAIIKRGELWQLTTSFRRAARFGNSEAKYEDKGNP